MFFFLFLFFFSENDYYIVNINFYLLFAFECMGSYHFLLVWAGFVAAFLWILGFVIGFIEIRYQSDGSGSGFFSLEIDFSVLLWSWISLSVEQSRAGLRIIWNFRCFVELSWKIKLHVKLSRAEFGLLLSTDFWIKFVLLVNSTAFQLRTFFKKF